MNQSFTSFARAKQAAEHFQISRSALWDWVRNRPGFPQPIKAGPRVTLFDLAAIETFIRSQASKARKQAGGHE
jgi:predicted DNA-binding transcriptional regulator AlpA